MGPLTHPASGVASSQRHDSAAAERPLENPGTLKTCQRIRRRSGDRARRFRPAIVCAGVGKECAELGSDQRGSDIRDLLNELFKIQLRREPPGGPG